MINKDNDFSIQIPHPNDRLKEISSIRIYSDDNIELILNELRSIRLEINKLKSQISAHDYNMVNKLGGGISGDGR